MKNKKMRVFTILVLLLALVTAGCGSGKENTPPAGTEALYIQVS